MPPLSGQNPQHHLALSDEQAPAAHQIALPDVAIGGDARIVGIIDGDDSAQGGPSWPFRTRGARTLRRCVLWFSVRTCGMLRRMSAIANLCVRCALIGFVAAAGLALLAAVLIER
jgi:hypothetical protein